MSAKSASKKGLTAHKKSAVEIESPKMRQALGEMRSALEAQRKAIAAIDAGIRALENADPHIGPPGKTILSLEQVAKRLRCSPSMIRKEAQLGLIPFFRIGKLYRFDAEDLDRWIEAATTGKATGES